MLEDMVFKYLQDKKETVFYNLKRINKSRKKFRGTDFKLI